MVDEEGSAGASAFCDEIIGKFIETLEHAGGLEDVAVRLKEQLLINNKFNEAAIREALFGAPRS